MIGLVADDLTGAADASVQFAQRGWPTVLSLQDAGEIHLPTEVVDEMSVVAVTTDARPLPEPAAEKLTHDALARLIQSGAERVFLKIDSTMRGSVRAQIAGALTGWRPLHAEARAVVCPAYPRMGRTVESGRLLVNGIPVHLTSFASDPITPVHTSDIQALGMTSPLVEYADAVTDEDLRRLARSIVSSGPGVIPVGSGGLAGAVADAIPGMRTPPDWSDVPLRVSRILLLVTSLNPVAQRQVARLPGDADVKVIVAPTERVPDTSVADDLAAQFAGLALRERWDLFGLVGGDGARAALRRLGAYGIRIGGSLSEGIPFGTIFGGRCDGTMVFTKAGGFGDEDALVEVVKRMRE